MIAVSIYGIKEPLKSQGTLKLDIKLFKKNEQVLISSRRTYGIFLLIGEIFYSFLSLMILLNKIEISPFENIILVLLIVFAPIPFMFIIHFIKFDKNGNLRKEK